MLAAKIKTVVRSNAESESESESESTMESDDEFELLPSSPVHERKLKRLKKATRVPEHSHPPTPPLSFSDSGNGHHLTPLTDSNGESGPELETLGTSLTIPQPDTPKGVTVDDYGLSAKRVLDFDSVGEEHGKVDEENKEVRDLKINEEVRDLNTDGVERKRRSLDEFPEKKEKKKKRIEDGGGSEKKSKDSSSNKRKTDKGRQETLKQLRAESQRLLRETRDAAFKPAPLVQKPISSILDKIRQRKLEILKKSSASFEDDDDFVMDEEVPDRVEKVLPEVPDKIEKVLEEVPDKVEKAEPEETPATSPALDLSHVGELNHAAHISSSDIPSPTVVGSTSEHAFRAPIGDTQELFDSERSDPKDEAVNEKSNNPSEEMFAPSMLTMNLKLDSAPPDDDDDVSSDEEDNDKENIDPHVQGSVDLTLSPSGDPVRAFVDEEAEEEDDSDNDQQRFQDNEEYDDDIEELDDMFVTQYEEKSSDREKCEQFHQQWLEKQDTTVTNNILQKHNCGSKLKATLSLEEEDDESGETEDEYEVEEYTAPKEDIKTTLKMVKQMIPQMYSDKDDKYVSSDDEETKEKLDKQYLYYKTKEKAKFFSPAEDESSREVFSRIKKLNVVPDTKRKGRITSIYDMPLTGQNMNISSKSSFIGKASDRYMPTSRKQGSCKVRSFIFGRDDSNSRSSILMSEDSSDVPQKTEDSSYTIERESQPPKTASAKFQRNTQNKITTVNSTSEKPNVSLMEILRKSSHQAGHSVQTFQPEGSVFDAFKLVKKPSKTEARV